MSGSKRFAKKARRIIYESNRGDKEREEIWRVRQQRQKQQQKTEAELKQEEKQIESESDSSSTKEKEQVDNEDNEDLPSNQVDLACACGDRCKYAAVLANLTRVLFVAFDEYELLHACYSDQFVDTRRASCEDRVHAYRRTFADKSTASVEPHEHCEALLSHCIKERDNHFAEKANLPMEIVTPVRSSLLNRLLNPFGLIECNCMRCAYLDEIMNYRVALFALLTEYCQLYEDYAKLVWSSGANLSESGLEVQLLKTEDDINMFKRMMDELHYAMSFDGDTHNVVSNLDLMQKLIIR